MMSENREEWKDTRCVQINLQDFVQDGVCVLGLDDQKVES